jgi:hypothetical protein
VLIETKEAADSTRGRKMFVKGLKGRERGEIQ